MAPPAFQLTANPVDSGIIQRSQSGNRSKRRRRKKGQHKKLTATNQFKPTRLKGSSRKKREEQNRSRRRRGKHQAFKEKRKYDDLVQDVGPATQPMDVDPSTEAVALTDDTIDRDELAQDIGAIRFRVPKEKGKGFNYRGLDLSGGFGSMTNVRTIKSSINKMDYLINETESGNEVYTQREKGKRFRQESFKGDGLEKLKAARKILTEMLEGNSDVDPEFVKMLLGDSYNLKSQTDHERFYANVIELAKQSRQGDETARKKVKKIWRNSDPVEHKGNRKYMHSKVRVPSRKNSKMLWGSGKDELLKTAQTREYMNRDAGYVPGYQPWSNGEETLGWLDVQKSLRVNTDSLVWSRDGIIGGHTGAIKEDPGNKGFVKDGENDFHMDRDRYVEQYKDPVFGGIGASIFTIDNCTRPEDIDEMEGMEVYLNSRRYGDMEEPGNREHMKEAAKAARRKWARRTYKLAEHTGFPWNELQKKMIMEVGDIEENPPKAFNTDRHTVRDGFGRIFEEHPFH